MRVIFDIKDHDKVYNVLVNYLLFEKECFLTDNCIEIDEEVFDILKHILFYVKFEKI